MRRGLAQPVMFASSREGEEKLIFEADPSHSHRKILIMLLPIR
jgi:hypothetical protein